ncbi:MAG: isoleucine-tRNA ligase [Bogoriella megaspora]|nr:MAG: isoleucine-tRNA ligase [Bogoriella megaspora]
MSTLPDLEPNLGWTINTSTSTLELSTLPPPSPPSPSQSLIRIHAAALNYRDLLVLQSSPRYPVQTSPGLVPCTDGCGTIVSTSPDSPFVVGDVVLPHPNTWVDGHDVRNFHIAETLGGGDINGTLQRYLVVDNRRLVKAPSNLKAEEAAGLNTAMGTAWNALFWGPDGAGDERWKAKKGMTVLSQGTGGVSTAVVQLAAAVGATVIATTSSPERMELLKKLGAKHTINYRETPDWASEVLRITNGKGVDHVVDVAGVGTIEQSLRAVRTGGLVSVIGILTEGESTDLVPYILFGAKVVRGVLGSASEMMKEGMVKLIEEHDIHPVVGKEYNFEEAPRAFKDLETQSSVGKLVIKV